MMRYNEYYSDRKMRFIFSLSQLQLLEAKAGDAPFNIEDIRFCYHCDRWFDADYHITIVEQDGDVDFVCSRCADYFEKLTPSNKKHLIMCNHYNFRYWKDQLQMAIQRATHPCTA